MLQTAGRNACVTSQCPSAGFRLAGIPLIAVLVAACAGPRTVDFSAGHVKAEPALREVAAPPARPAGQKP